MATIRRIVLSTALIVLGAASLSAFPAPAQAQASILPATGCLTDDVGSTGQADPGVCTTNGLTPAQTAANVPTPPAPAPVN